MPRSTKAPASRATSAPGAGGRWFWASSCAAGFLGLAVGFWIVFIAGGMAVVALVGWVYEYSRGDHAH